MVASKGGLSEERILKMHWRRFGLYLDACSWMQREQSEEGRAQNRGDDLKAMRQSPEWKAAVKRLKEETYRDTAKHVRFAEQNPTGGTTTDMLKAG